jgi:hypothetical protein
MLLRAAAAVTLAFLLCCTDRMMRWVETMGGADAIPVRDGELASRRPPHRSILHLLRCRHVMLAVVGCVVCAVAAAMTHGGVVARFSRQSTPERNMLAYDDEPAIHRAYAHGGYTPPRVKSSLPRLDKSSVHLGKN